MTILSKSPLALGLLLLSPLARQEPQAGPPSAAAEELVLALAAGDVRLDPARGLVSIPAEILVRRDLLEYLLVRVNGSSHESLFLTSVDASLLNAGLLALGVEPGRNAVWTAVDPPPTEEERRAGVEPFDVTPPEGDGLYMYAAWRDGDEVFLYRVEDLINNLETGRSMKRHPWVFLGSAFLQRKDEGEVFAAAQYGNLVNVSYFSEGYTLATAALPECLAQTIWAPNYWLLPERGSMVDFVFAREPLVSLPDAWQAELPDLAAEAPGG